MWSVANETPFEADRTWVRDADGHHQFIVAVRATYAVDAQGGLRLAERQVPPALAPVYRGDDGASSLTPGPNVVYPGQDVARAGPARFGALCSDWSPRQELASTYDARWEDTRKPLLPANYDPRFTQCSPRDQQPGH